MDTLGTQGKVEREQVVLKFYPGKDSQGKRGGWCARGQLGNTEILYLLDRENKKEIESQNEVWWCEVTNTINAQRPGQIISFVLLKTLLVRSGEQVVCNFIKQMRNGKQGPETVWGCKRFDKDRGIDILYIPSRGSAHQPTDVSAWVTETAGLVHFNVNRKSAIVAVALLEKAGEAELKRNREEKRERSAANLQRTQESLSRIPASAAA